VRIATCVDRRRLSHPDVLAVSRVLGTATRGMTKPREDLPTVGDEIAVVHCAGFWYYGPLTVTAVEPGRPRVTLHRTMVSIVTKEPFESDEVHDGAEPTRGGPPYSKLRWHLLADLSEEEKAAVLA